MANIFLVWSSPLFAVSGCFFGTNKFLKICIYPEESNLLESHRGEVMKVLLMLSAWLRGAGSVWNPAAARRSFGVSGSPPAQARVRTKEKLKGFSFLTTWVTEKPGKREIEDWDPAWALESKTSFLFWLPFRWAVFYVFFLSQCLCTTWISLQAHWSCKVCN